MKDQASVGEETPAIKYDRALSLFTESVMKPDHDLRGCAHNQGCYEQLMEIRQHVLDYLKTLKEVTHHTNADESDELAWRGYSYMLITSKTGAIIDGEKVDREEFFNVLNAWGQDPDKRFVVLHHSILSEGINVKGLEAVLFMRSMDYVGISQTIGRVIRKGAKDKVFGLVCIPVYSKVGISTARKVEAVVDTIFNKGEAATSVITK